MDHILTRRLVVATVAAIAAVSVLLATTFVPPKPTTELAGPPISVEVVQLAAASADQITLPNVVGGVAAGAGAGLFFGFLVFGQLAANVIYRIPGAGTTLAPLISAIGVVGAIIVGVPIGAVLGAVSSVTTWVSSLRSQLAPPASASPIPARKAVVTAPQRSSKPGARSDRQTTKAPAVAKVSAPQQRSKSTHGVAGSARDTDANRVARH